MRKSGYDLCRAIACFTVVAGHTMMLFWDFDPASRLWAVYNFLMLVARFSVPVFFLIPGALMLERKTLDFGRHMRRVGHLLLLFYAWSVICRVIDACCGRVWCGEEPLALLILQGYFHLWFLPALAMCYCALPLLHGLAHGDAANVRRGALLLSGIVLVLTTLEAVPDKPAWLAALLTPYGLGRLRYLVYFLLGWLLSKKLLSGRQLTVLGLASLALCLVFAWLNRRAAIRAGEAVETYFGTLMLYAAVTACFAFALCLRLEGFAARHAALLQKLSGCSLGIYLMHPIFMDLLRGAHLDLSAYSAAWLLPACCLAFLLLPLALTLILQKLPLLKKLVS